MSKSFGRLSAFCKGAFSIVGVASLLSGCDFFSASLFSSSSVNSVGSRYDDTADEAYCGQLRRSDVSNSYEAYQNCMRQRRNGPRGGGSGPSGCVEGGPLDHRSVCTTRTNSYGNSVRECVEIPNCRRPHGDYGDGHGRHFYPNADVSLSENVKGYAKQSLRNTVSSVVSSSAVNTPTVAETLSTITPEKMVLVDNMSLSSAKIVRSALFNALNGDSSELEKLGFTADEIEGFLARNDPTSADEDRYNQVAKKLDMQGSTLSAFVSKVLGVVVDTRWEIYNQQEHKEN